MTDSPERMPPRAREILKHFVDNPEAVDSLEGVAAWRLLEEVVQQRVEETRQAIGWLVLHDFLVRSPGTAAAPPLYRLNVERRTEAERFLHHGGPGDTERETQR